jgi:uncharacterized membrane protein
LSCARRLAAALAYKQLPAAGLLLLAALVCFVAATATTLLVNVPIDEMMAGSLLPPRLR